MDQVFELFKDSTDLLVGFNTFLPPGFKIHVDGTCTGPDGPLNTPRDLYKGCSADQLLRIELLLRHGGSAAAAFQAMAVNKEGGGYVSRAGMRCAMRELGLTTNEEWKAVRAAVFGTSAVSTSHEGQMSISLADFERWVNSVRLTILRADGESLHLGIGTDTPILPDVLTVGDLKCLIAKRTGVRSADQELFVDTRTDTNTDCKLRDCDTLTNSGIAGSCSNIWVLSSMPRYAPSVRDHDQRRQRRTI
jgi:hypothetical protein